MPERWEWVVRAIAVPIEEDEEEEGEAILYLGDWEPFSIMEDYILCKKQVMVDDDEKSSTRHQLSFSERYE